MRLNPPKCEAPRPWQRRGGRDNKASKSNPNSTAQPVGVHAKAAMFALIQRQPAAVRQELTAWAAQLVGGRDGC